MNISPYIIPGISNPLEIACNMFNVTSENIKSSSRKREYVIPRHILMFYYHNVKKNKLKDVAKMMNKSNHTAVIHGIRSFKKDMITDKNYRDDARKFFKAVI